MDLNITPSNTIEGKINAPASKSHTHRAIIAATLAQGVSTIHNPLLSDDCRSSLRAAHAFGAHIDTLLEDKIEITGTFPKVPNKTIDVGNSGTTLRFFTGIASLCNEKITLTGDKSIQRRPMAPLCNALEKLGVYAKTTPLGTAPVTVQGPLVGGNALVTGSSSQFISSLLFAAPFAKKECRILYNDPKSTPYIDMTCEWLKKTGISVSHEKYHYTVESNQKYRCFNEFISGDYSNAAFFIVLGCISGKIKINNLDKNDTQGDKAIIGFLKEMGANIMWNNNTLVCEQSNLEGKTFNLANTPDLVPPLTIAACFAKGETRLENIAHVRLKESDRLAVLSKELKLLGADITEDKDALIIKESSLQGNKVHSHGDHRIAMALAIAASQAQGDSIIKDSHCISISYPQFLKDYTHIGAKGEMK